MFEGDGAVFGDAENVCARAGEGVFGPVVFGKGNENGGDELVLALAGAEADVGHDFEGAGLGESDLEEGGGGGDLFPMI